MGKERIFSIFPFLNAMSAETIKAPPTDLSVYPFYNTYYVTYIQDTLSYVFSSGSSVTSVITNKNVKRVVSSQAKDIITQYEIAIVGRSNSGKSSLINALLQEQVAIPSKTPGKTQQLIFHTLNAPPPLNFTLVDAPGYGYAEAPDMEMEKWKNITQEYFCNATHLKSTIVLIDSRRGIMKSDEILFEFLNEYRRINTIVLTKSDCLKPGELKNQMIKVAHVAAKYPRTFGTVFATSSKLEYGIKELRMYLLFAITNPEAFEPASK